MREPRGLLPSGGKATASLLSHERPAPYGRGVGLRGTAPYRGRMRMKGVSSSPWPLGLSAMAS